MAANKSNVRLTARLLRSTLSFSLALSALIFIPAFTPAANAAPCAPTVGTLSGTSRYAIFNSGTGCTWTVPAGVTNISYLAVGGGGGGGGARAIGNAPDLGGGGGGAGGIVQASTFSTISGSTITLTIGLGGSGGESSTAGGNGGNTAFTYSSTTVTASGGGGGGGSNGTSDQNNLAGDGGNNNSYTGGANVWDGGGGGAGSAAVGIAGTDIGGQGGTGGAGGTATLNALLGANAYYGGGGGGGGTPSTNLNESDGTGGAGGSSVGGNGGGSAGVQPTAGATNSGSGGGGGGWRSSSSNALRAGASGADGRIVFTFTKTDSAITSATVSSNAGGDNFYRIGEFVSVTLTANESVTVTGSPRIPVLGLTSKFFTYFSGSGTSSLVFRYTVVTSDTASAGVGIAANTLALNGGTLLDSAGFNLPLTHLAIAQSTNHRVDGILPNLSAMPQSYSVPENETRTITLTPSESVTFSIANAVDLAYFVFNSATGVLSLTPRDFENPLDSGADNVYYIAISMVDLAGNATGGYNFNFTVTNVAEAARLALPTLSTVATKGMATTISVASDVAGKVAFFWNGKRIPGCLAVDTTGSAPNIAAQCTWKPTTTAPSTIYARITPTSSSFSVAASSSLSILPARRTTRR